MKIVIIVVVTGNIIAIFRCVIQKHFFLNQQYLHFGSIDGDGKFFFLKFSKMKNSRKIDQSSLPNKKHVFFFLKI